MLKRLWHYRDMDNTNTTPNASTLPTPQTGAKWAAIRRGDGRITAHIEVWFSQSAGRWMTIPGASRFINATS